MICAYALRVRNVMNDLTLHRTLHRAALSASHIFAWIMLFDALRSFGSTYAALGFIAGFYVAAHFLSFIFAPLAGKALRYGIRRALSLSVISYAAALMSLAAAFTGVFGGPFENAFWGSLGFIVFYALHRALYFAPFSVEAGMVEYHTRTFSEVALAIIPAAVGVLLVLPQGFMYALLLGVALSLASLIPVRTLPERYERFEWSFGEAFSALFVKAHRRLVWSSFFDGMQAAGLLFFWPLALFFLFSGSYVALGFCIALTLLLTLLVRHYAHPYVSSKVVWTPDTRATVMLGSWLIRLSAFSPLSAAAADAVYYSASPHRVYALDPLTFEQMADGGSYLDELTTLKEMSYAMGKICIGLLAGGMAATESLYLFFGVAFVCAVFASLISVYMVRSESRIA